MSAEALTKTLKYTAITRAIEVLGEHGGGAVDLGCVSVLQDMQTELEQQSVKMANTTEQERSEILFLAKKAMIIDLHGNYWKPNPNHEALFKFAELIRQRDSGQGEAVATVYNSEKYQIEILPTTKAIKELKAGDKLYTQPQRAKDAYEKAAKIAEKICFGRQTKDDAGSTRWLEAGKCGRQTAEAIRALITDTQEKG